MLRTKLALVHPTLMTVGGFDYVEGEGLEADEAEESRQLLPRTLDKVRLGCCGVVLVALGGVALGCIDSVCVVRCWHCQKHCHANFADISNTPKQQQE